MTMSGLLPPSLSPDAPAQQPRIQSSAGGAVEAIDVTNLMEGENGKEEKDDYMCHDPEEEENTSIMKEEDVCEEEEGGAVNTSTTGRCGKQYPHDFRQQPQHTTLQQQQQGGNGERRVWLLEEVAFGGSGDIDMSRDTDDNRGRGVSNEATERLEQWCSTVKAEGRKSSARPGGRRGSARTGGRRAASARTVTEVETDGDERYGCSWSVCKRRKRRREKGQRDGERGTIEGSYRHNITTTKDSTILQYRSMTVPAIGSCTTPSLTTIIPNNKTEEYQHIGQPTISSTGIHKLSPTPHAQCVADVEGSTEARWCLDRLLCEYREIVDVYEGVKEHVKRLEQTLHNAK
eukprot:GHVQ01008278.1.p1 GENE.GHVQ01008278.1~~GHVQ01008278.1.p1  ORF type:complete len:346 (+),score=88.46 GHVQ01008278.1:619-1656(+)